MSLLSPADYPDIRAQLGTSIDATMVPDDLIALDGFSGAAQREVVKADPIAEIRTGGDLARVRLAAVLLTAARIAPRLPQITSNEFEGERFQLAKVDYDALSHRLREEAYAEIEAVLTVDTPDDDEIRPTVFAVASRLRGSTRPRCWW